MEKKDEGFLLGLGLLGLLVYFVYDSEKKRLRNEAKASTKEQISPIIDALNTDIATNPTPLPPQLPDRLKVLEDIMFNQDIFDESGNLIGQDLVFVIPKDTVIPMYIVYDEKGKPFTQVETQFGLANIDILKTQNVSGDTPLSNIVAISAYDYYNKSKELWNPPTAVYQVGNLETSSSNGNEDWKLNYYDAKGDEQEVIVPAQTNIIVVAVDTNHVSDSVVTNFESTILEVKEYVKYGTYRVLDDIFYDCLADNPCHNGNLFVPSNIPSVVYQKEIENGYACGCEENRCTTFVIPKGRILNMRVVINKDGTEEFVFDGYYGQFKIDKNKIEQVPLDTPVSEITIENDIELLKYNSDFQDFFGRYRKPLLECDEFSRLFAARNKKIPLGSGGHVLSDSEIQAFIDQQSWGEDFFKNDGFVQQVELDAIANHKSANPEIYARNFILEGEF